MELLGLFGSLWGTGDCAYGLLASLISLSVKTSQMLRAVARVPPEGEELRVS